MYRIQLFLCSKFFTQNKQVFVISLVYSEVEGYPRFYIRRRPFCCYYLLYSLLPLFSHSFDVTAFPLSSAFSS